MTEILYTGTDALRVTLRDGRAVAFSLEDPQHSIPDDSARDLLSRAIGGGKFIRFVLGGE